MNSTMQKSLVSFLHEENVKVGEKRRIDMVRPSLAQTYKVKFFNKVINNSMVTFLLESTNVQREKTKLKCKRTKIIVI